MITYIKMKYLEWKLKLAFYRYALYLKTYIDNEGKDLMELLHKSYLVLKETPLDDLQKQLVIEIAKVVHETGTKNED